MGDEIPLQASQEDDQRSHGVSPWSSAAKNFTLSKTHQRRIAALPKRWRTSAGVDRCLDAFAGGAFPPALDFDAMDVPVLSGLARVTPIPDLDGLLNAVSTQVGRVQNDLELECILDGISRFGTCRDGNFERRAQPLRKQISRAVGVVNRLGGMLDSQICWATLSPLLHWWLGETRTFSQGVGMVETLESEDGSRVLFPTGPFVVGRIREIRQRLLREEAQGTLCLPTHEGGWICPVEFVRRLQGYSAAGVSIGKYDFIQALLRLAPEGRKEALMACRGLTFPWAGPARWALGARSIKPKGTDDIDLWLAAERARNPRARAALLDKAGLDEGLGNLSKRPDALNPAHYSWEVHEEERKVGKRPLNRAYDSLIRFNVTPRCPKTEIPVAQLSSVQHYCTSFTAWPQNRDAFTAKLIGKLLENYSKRGVRSEEAATALSLLAGPDEGPTELFCMALCVGMLSMGEDIQLVATDIASDGIADGRLDADRLAPILIVLQPAPWFRLKRLAISLERLGDGSLLHTWVAADLMQRILVRYDTLPRDVPGALEWLYDQLDRIGDVPSPFLCRQLKILTGQGKAAIVAKKLLGLEPEDNGQIAEVNRMILEARIARAERWAAAGGRL